VNHARRDLCGGCAEMCIPTAIGASKPFLGIRMGRKRHAWPSQIIREAIRFVHQDAKRDESLIDVQIADDLPPILVEQIQIQEVLINLISNGIEAMESNALPPHLMTRVTLVNECELLIEVIDNGPGLKDTQSIFDAFVTTKEKVWG
jgi:C4-dicarboxylate-specific signal transduction histidine kinase